MSDSGNLSGSFAFFSDDSDQGIPQKDKSTTIKSGSGNISLVDDFLSSSSKKSTKSHTSQVEDLLKTETIQKADEPIDLSFESTKKASKISQGSQKSSRSRLSEKKSSSSIHETEPEKPAPQPSPKSVHLQEVSFISDPVPSDPPAKPARQKKTPWYDEKPEPPKRNADQDAEIARLQNIIREQRTVIDNQKETIKLLMNEAVSHEEISSLRAALASKSPLLQLVAATPMSEQKATTQLRAENAALRREIEEIETRHLAELKAMRAQFASLSSRQMPTDGCAQCKRRIRELEAEVKRLSSV